MNSTLWKTRCSLKPKAQAVNKAQQQLRPEPYFPIFFKSRAQVFQWNFLNCIKFSLKFGSKRFDLKLLINLNLNLTMSCIFLRYSYIVFTQLYNRFRTAAISFSRSFVNFSILKMGMYTKCQLYFILSEQFWRKWAWTSVSKF